MHDFLPDPTHDSEESSDEEIHVVPENIQVFPSDSSTDTEAPSHSELQTNQGSSSQNTSTENEEGRPGNWYFSDSDEEEQGATVEEVFNIEPAVEAKREQPPDIDVGAATIDVKFHPSTEILAAATLDAEVVCYRYNTKQEEELGSSEHHDSALRSLAFSRDGCSLYTASKDHTVAVLDTETWTVKKHYLSAHSTSVYSLCPIGENLFASGDDDGILKVWDVRRKMPVFMFKCGEETINAIIVDDSEKTIVAAINDGSITALNLARRKLIMQSEMYDSAMNCLAVVRNGTRLAVGTDKGDLQIFKWGEFSNHVDSVPEQPKPIMCMQAVADNRVITGCEDGCIRAINLYPHRYVGVVGCHPTYGIEAISVSCDQRFLASCNADDIVRFWDLQHLHDVETGEGKKACKSRDLRNHLGSSRERNPTEFFSDMASEIPSDDDYIGPVDRPKNVE